MHFFCQVLSKLKIYVFWTWKICTFILALNLKSFSFNSVREFMVHRGSYSKYHAEFASHLTYWQVKNTCIVLFLYILSGADVDASGAKGRTILFIAVLESSLNCMELLLKNGCKTNVRDNHGFTILKTIFKTNSIIKAEAIKLLQKFGQFILVWDFFTAVKSYGI